MAEKIIEFVNSKKAKMSLIGIVSILGAFIAPDALGLEQVQGVTNTVIVSITTIVGIYAGGQAVVDTKKESKRNTEAENFEVE